MIITGAWTALLAVLAGLGTGGPWTAVAAIFLAAMLIVTLGDPQLRAFAGTLDDMLVGLFRRRPEPVLPGPGQPQASGVSGAEDTRFGDWSDDELAELHALLEEGGGSHE